jgi:hypothetical protein
VRITYDRDANAAYIHLGDPHKPGHATTRAQSPPGVDGFIALDWQNNRLVGIGSSTPTSSSLKRSSTKQTTPTERRRTARA